MSKDASKWVKPNGLTVIELTEVEKFLSKTHVEKIWGIGPKTSELLIRKGIKTAQDFVKKDLEWIKKNFSKPYEAIWLELKGVMVMEIDPKLKTVYSSIQKTRSFHPATNNKIFLLSQLSKHIEDACRKARYYKLVPKKFSIFLKTKDFKYSNVLIQLPSPSNSPEILTPLARENFDKIYSKNLLYRTTGVVLQDLTQNFVAQNDLFGSNNKTDKFKTIHEQIDALENKFGKRAVYLASTHEALKCEEKGTDADEIDRDLLFL